MKKASSVVTTLVVVSCLFGLSGCIAAIGNDAPLAPTPNVTLGQQLIDLNKAHEAGIITDAEYQAQRAKFLGKK